jgi:hypothetical protein
LCRRQGLWRTRKAFLLCPRGDISRTPDDRRHCRHLPFPRAAGWQSL